MAICEPKKIIKKMKKYFLQRITRLTEKVKQ